MSLKSLPMSEILPDVLGIDVSLPIAQLLDNGDMLQGPHKQSVTPEQKPPRFENAVDARMTHVLCPGSSVRYTRHRGDTVHVGVVVACIKKGYLVQHGRHKKNRSRLHFVHVLGKSGEPSYRYESG